MLPAAREVLIPGHDAVKLGPQPEPPDYPKDWYDLLLLLMEPFGLLD
jgi:hypothetical protein